MYFKSSKTIVIKIGSSLIVEKKSIRKKWLQEFSKDVKNLIKQNKRVIIVTSGAIAMGCKKLNLNKKNIKLDKSQAIASIGQIELMNLFSQTFANYKLNVRLIMSFLLLLVLFLLNLSTVDFFLFNKLFLSIDGILLLSSNNSGNILVIGLSTTNIIF